MMKDRKGNEVSAGDRVYVIPDPVAEIGGFGRIVAVKNEQARVESENEEWLARVKSHQFEKA